MKRNISTLVISALLSACTIISVPAYADSPAVSDSISAPAALRGWQHINGKTYYYSANGKMRTGWRKIGGSIYYFGKDGVMRTGKVKVGSKTFDFGEDGRLIRDYTVTVNGSKIACANPYYSENALMVPLKEIAAALGYLYSTDENGAITIDDNYIQSAKLTVGSKDVEFDGRLKVIDLSRTIAMEAAAEEKGGCIFVPLSFFAEFFNDAECTGRDISISPSMCYID